MSMCANTHTTEFEVDTRPVFMFILVTHGRVFQRDNIKIRGA